jgi:hypothetical protein
MQGRAKVSQRRDSTESAWRQGARVAQHGTAQHSTRRFGRGGACWAGYSRRLVGYFLFFFSRARVEGGRENGEGFVSGGYLNTYLPLGWCRGVGLLGLGRGLCCVCVCVWWGLWWDL